MQFLPDIQIAFYQVISVYLMYPKYIVLAGTHVNINLIQVIALYILQLLVLKLVVTFSNNLS